MLTPLEQQLLFSRLPSVGCATYWKVLEHVPGLSAFLNLPAETLRQLLPAEAVNSVIEFQEYGENSTVYQQVLEDREWAERYNVHLIDSNSEYYPELLRETKKAPPLLFVMGDPSCLSFPQVSIVGSRSPSPGGKNNAMEFGAELAKHGFTITSGLALGADTAAHTGALMANGRTVAVLGTGVNKIYPARNRELADSILANGGAIVSEFPLGTEALPQNFPQRNRIISGLSYGCLVVEAALKSGSLITARYAMQQNREVFAIPGSIHNPLSKGCHQLIKDGAKLVETAKDIADELEGFLSMSWEQLQISDNVNTAEIVEQLVTNEAEDIVLAQLGYDTTTIDTLVERTGLPVGDVMSALLTMELKGCVVNTGTGYTRMEASKGMLAASSNKRLA